jgi:hypothetical protein
MTATPPTAGSESDRELLDMYRIPDTDIYVIGTFDRGITVLNQQVRALNLVWAMIETNTVSVIGAGGSRCRIAIVGGGFAGVTTAAALLQKGADAELTLFEQRDTLLPLQQGCDSRWIHPHIYDWPAAASESSSAALPILNWTASRASDVVVQVLRGWTAITDATQATSKHVDDIAVYCNTRHLQVRGESGSSGLQVEWVGESRNPSNPAVGASSVATTVGRSQEFDMVVLALGFGLERGLTSRRGGRGSYWRNETLAQPHLDESTVTYIVSGGGDGALIDLFRLRIAQFRQDRILHELFATHPALIARLREVERQCRDDRESLFDELTQVWEADAEIKANADQVVHDLAGRLRRDTRAVLHLDVRNFSDLFSNDRRVSFQNRLLAFLLYRCGGFYPSTDKIETLAAELNVPRQRIVRRHGTKRTAALNSVLSDQLQIALKKALKSARDDTLKQPDLPAWNGGFFGYRGPTLVDGAVSDAVKAAWRKEYLPGPTQALAISLCAAVAGSLVVDHDPTKRLRITLHRTLLLGGEALLQQCCEYTGLKLEPTARPAAGRTFPSTHATIGLAYESREIVRTIRDAKLEDIESDMATLQLHVSSRKMAESVRSLLAIPLLATSLRDHRMAGGELDDVVGVLYLDSEEGNAFSDDLKVRRLTGMAERFLLDVTRPGPLGSTNLVNGAFWAEPEIDRRPLWSETVFAALEKVAINPARAESEHYINYDYSDFAPVE